MLGFPTRCDACCNTIVAENGSTPQDLLVNGIGECVHSVPIEAVKCDSGGEAGGGAPGFNAVTEGCERVRKDVFDRREGVICFVAQVRNSAYLLGVCLLLQSNMLTLASEAIPALSSFDSNLSPKPGDATSTSSTSDGSVMPEFAKMTLADSGQLLSKLESTFSDQAADRAPLPAASEALNIAGEQTTYADPNLLLALTQC